MNSAKRGSAAFGVRRRLAAIAIATVAVSAEAHDQPVHQAISHSAVLSSAGLGLFLNDALGDPETPLLFQPDGFPAPVAYPAIYWVTNGAYHEDDRPRFGDHFYTVAPIRVPGAVQGLTDWHESLFLPGNTANSYAWATTIGLHAPFILFYPSPPENTENWDHARNY